MTTYGGTHLLPFVDMDMDTDTTDGDEETSEKIESEVDIVQRGCPDCIDWRKDLFGYSSSGSWNSFEVDVTGSHNLKMETGKRDLEEMVSSLTTTSSGPSSPVRKKQKP